MRRLSILLVTAVLIATACGGSSSSGAASDPEGTLLTALLRTKSGPSTVTVSLHSNAKSVQALKDRGGDERAAGKHIDMILNSSLTISQSGDSDPSRARSELSLTLAGQPDALEARTVDGKLYLRVDALGFLHAFGKDPSELRHMAGEARSAGLSFVGPALHGRWLSLPSRNKTGAAPGSANQQARDAFLQKLLASATVSSVGQDSAGDHLAIKVPARQVYAGLKGYIAQMGGAGLPFRSPLPSAEGIPDKEVRIDAWVRDGRLTQLEVDLLQFAALSGQPPPAGVQVLAIRMTFQDFTGTIEAPSGAVQVDPKELAKTFLGRVHQAAVGSASASPL